MAMIKCYGCEDCFALCDDVEYCPVRVISGLDDLPDSPAGCFHCDDCSVIGTGSEIDCPMYTINRMIKESKK